MNILHELSNLLSAELFGILAGFTIVALSIVGSAVYARLEKSESQKNSAQVDKPTIKDVNNYLGSAFFISSSTYFIAGLILTLIFQSLEIKYTENAIFEIISVILRGIALVVGLITLLGGMDTVSRSIIGRNLRFFSGKLSVVLALLEVILPTPHPSKEKVKKDTEATIKKLESISNSKDTEFESLRRNLADQLNTAFVAALIVLGVLAVRIKENVTLERAAWWVWAIAAIILLVVELIVGIKKQHKMRHPKLMWVFIVISIATFGLMYYLSGISFKDGFFGVLAVLLVIYSLLMKSMLITIKLGKLTPDNWWGSLTKSLGNWKGQQLLILNVFLLSVFSGWLNLWAAGMRDWWMFPILVLGVVAYFLMG